MARQRRSEDYAQLGIGDCGDVVHTWPQITGLNGREPTRVICDDCTKEKYGIDPLQPLTVWVRLKQEKLSPIIKPRKKAPKKVTKKPKSAWAALLEQEGLF